MEGFAKKINKKEENLQDLSKSIHGTWKDEYFTRVNEEDEFGGFK